MYCCKLKEHFLPSVNDLQNIFFLLLKELKFAFPTKKLNSTMKVSSLLGLHFAIILAFVKSAHHFFYKVAFRWVFQGNMALHCAVSVSAKRSLIQSVIRPILCLFSY